MILVTTFAYVAQHVAEVTPEHIGRCHKVFDLNDAGKAFHLVENERGECDEQGQVIEYTVKYDAKIGFTCSCKSGSYGFANIQHASRVCKHVRWTVAAVLEERAYLQELAEQAEQARQDGEVGTRPHYLEVNGHEATPREYARVVAAQPHQPSEEEIKRDQARYAPRPFNLLK